MRAATRSIIGLDIGGTKIACVEGGWGGRIYQRSEIPTFAERPFERTFPALIEVVEQRLSEARAAGREVVALSVAVGGPLRIREGFLLNPPHLPGWHNIHLKRRLVEGFPELPVYVEHDGNAGALAEFRFGAGKNRRGLRHLIFLTFGTGLGAGFVLNGKILHGASDTAGEVGHWRLAAEGPEGFGKRGSWEGFASGTGLVQLASLRFPQRWQPDTPIRELVEAMLADDDEALAVAMEAGARMGEGLALLVDALNPQLIVFGSLGVVLGDRVLRSARQALAREALPQAVAACDIVPAALGTRIGDVASLMAALSEPSIARLVKGQAGDDFKP
ncbi:MAG TPA: ROK family protein [Steroidobacteraceae bacterium]|jgi:glucokinase|nr:ROK family protein [Steroidobacteraceae bacterium]